MKQPKSVTLTSDSPAIVHLCKKDKRVAKVISLVGDLTYTCAENPFAFLVHEIIEQMLSVKAGRKIFARLEALCNGTVSAEAIRNLTDDQIRSCGTSPAKVRYIRSLSEAVLSGALRLQELKTLDDGAIKKQLMALPGIGEWTANMYLIFVLDRPDVLPTNDVAFLQIYEWLYKTDDRSKKAVEKKCRKWKPYTSVAVRYFYRVLDSGLTREPFHLFK